MRLAKQSEFLKKRLPRTWAENFGLLEIDQVGTVHKFLGGHPTENN